jgi:hypothetical protein
MSHNFLLFFEKIKKNYLKIFAKLWTQSLYFWGKWFRFSKACMYFVATISVAAESFVSAIIFTT